MARHPPHLHREVSRHGKVTWRVRRKHGRRVTLTAEYGTPEFWAEYRVALEHATPPAAAPSGGSVEAVLNIYRRSPEWAALAPATRKQRETIYRAVLPVIGQVQLSKITSADLRASRDHRATTPHAANNFLKAMRGLFGWAAGRNLVKTNPTKDVPLLKGKNDAIGFHTWSEDELALFESRWPIGTRERLAFDLLLYTGLRRGDVVRLGRQHVRDGVLTLRTEKTGSPIVLPILPPLAASIDAATTGDLTFLVTDRGQPMVKESFGNWFRDACRAAAVPGSAHGLRKAGATRAAENGATEAQLMAMFGWSTGKMAQHYTRAADKKRLAGEGAKFLIKAQIPNENARTLRSGAGGKPKSPNKSGV